MCVYILNESIRGERNCKSIQVFFSLERKFFLSSTAKKRRNKFTTNLSLTLTLALSLTHTHTHTNTHTHFISLLHCQKNFPILMHEIKFGRTNSWAWDQMVFYNLEREKERWCCWKKSFHGQQNWSKKLETFTTSKLCFSFFAKGCSCSQRYFIYFSTFACNSSGLTSSLNPIL